MFKIAFADSNDWDYDIESPYEKPFGGSQSALCYLAEAMAQNNLEIYLLNHTNKPRYIRGVHCFNIGHVPQKIVDDIDVVIVLNQAEFGYKLREKLSDKTSLVLWTQHDTDQAAMQTLHDQEVQAVYDGIVFVSHWQCEQYSRCFGLDLLPKAVMQNAIAPSFYSVTEKLLSTTNIVSCKEEKPILAYTSTPFRGLDLLIEIFPKIRQSIPEVRLQIFSSMKVYQLAEESEYFHRLYAQCQQMEGVEYIGSLPQPELAAALQKATLLAYPNTFPETSCIAVMEAMASGCHVVTSALGALPETTAGFADLVDPPTSFTGVEDRAVYKEQFADRVIAYLKYWQHQQEFNSQELEQTLRTQLHYVHDVYTWDVRSQEWQNWLEPLIKTHQQKLIIQLQEQSNLIAQYEQAIAEYPQEIINYIYLMIQLLLQEREEEAQMVWFSAIADLDEADEQYWLQQLQVHLIQEETRQRNHGNLRLAELMQRLRL